MEKTIKGIEKYLTARVGDYRAVKRVEVNFNLLPDEKGSGFKWHTQDFEGDVRIYEEESVKVELSGLRSVLEGGEHSFERIREATDFYQFLIGDIEKFATLVEDKKSVTKTYVVR